MKEKMKEKFGYRCQRWHKIPGVPNGNDIKILAVTGDASPLEYGGGIIYICRDGINPDYVRWKFWDGVDTLPNSYDIDVADHVFTVSCVEVPMDDTPLFDDDDRPLPIGVIKEFDWVDWQAVKASAGLDRNIQEMSGGSLQDRLWLLEAAVGHYGAFEFDQYPVTYTGRELRRRWGKKFTR